MSNKFVFRLTTIITTFFPLYLLYLGKTEKIIIFEILAFIAYTLYIIPWLISFKKSMLDTMVNKESYVESIFLYAFDHEFKFGMIIFCGLTFSYYGYDIFAFLLILAGSSEAYMNYTVKQIHLNRN